MKCPYCGFENIAGSSHCEKCLHSFLHLEPVSKKKNALEKVLLTAPVSEILSGTSLLIASHSESLQKIISILQKENQSSLLVFKKKRMVGIISIRDILHKVAGKYKDLSQVSAEQIMTPNPECVPADAPIAYAIHLMALGGFRHVPVMAEDATPIAIVAIQDVLSYLDKRD